MPDALAKTIPIWCFVMNKLLFKDQEGKIELFTPKNVVGVSEHAQINARLGSFIADAEVPKTWETLDRVLVINRSGLVGSSD